jgi:hypothetical protein
MRDAFKEEEDVYNYLYCSIKLQHFFRYEQQLQSYLSQQMSVDQLAFTKENIQNNIETVS